MAAPSDLSENVAAKLQLLSQVRDYAVRAHRRVVDFIPGETSVPYAGRFFTEDEVSAAVSACLDFWLTLGPEGEAMERELAAQLGVRHVLLTNSGSSANLLAVAALTSHKLPAERRLRPGDEVITCASGFPTTVAPMVQNGAVPVFLDVDPLTGNPDFSRLEDAYVPGKTKVLMCAHALGNPFDLSVAVDFCRRHNLWLIEDNCDALGSMYQMAGELPRPTGSFGDLSTQSFYPPHHLTMGEGGAVNIARETRLKVLVESFRDWGRDCWCPSGKDNSCHKRFDWQLGELPKGYDHKYIYSHLGYNLKPTDIQAAIGRVQLRQLNKFGEARRLNWQYLRSGLQDLSDNFEFSLPTHATEWLPGSKRQGFGGEFSWKSSARSDPSWFGFMLLLRPGAPFQISALARYLTEKKIEHRRLFGGNLVRQPAFVQLRQDNAAAYRVVGGLEGSDRLMAAGLFIGVYPGLTTPMLDYVIQVIHEFCRMQKKGSQAL